VINLKKTTKILLGLGVLGISGYLLFQYREQISQSLDSVVSSIPNGNGNEVVSETDGVITYIPPPSDTTPVSISNMNIFRPLGSLPKEARSPVRPWSMLFERGQIQRIYKGR